MKLTALGLSYNQVGQLLGFAKSSLCKWLKGTPEAARALRGQVVEMDGLWTRTKAGKTELKVVRDEQGQSLLSLANWLSVVERLYQGGLEELRHAVSDGDRAIEEAISFVYGSEAPHQLCHFHLLQEYRRNIGRAGWEEAKALLGSKSLAEAEERVADVLAASRGLGAYWCRKVLEKGLTFLGTGQECFKTVSRLERLQRELRRRERLGTVWSDHNLVLLLDTRLALTFPK